MAPPPGAGRAPRLSRLVVSSFSCFRRLPADRASQTLTGGGCRGGARQSKFDWGAPPGRLPDPPQSKFDSGRCSGGVPESNFDPRLRVKVWSIERGRRATPRARAGEEEERESERGTEIL